MMLDWRPVIAVQQLAQEEVLEVETVSVLQIIGQEVGSGVAMMPAAQK